MKELFIWQNFSHDNIQIIKVANNILNEYAEMGYDLSLRQLYYQFVAKNQIENSESSYKKLGNIINNARLAGLIDWDMIKDRGRETVKNSHWNNSSEIIEAATKQFRLDKWANQKNYIEVMVEKQALEGVLIPVCKSLDIPFTANKGYCSSSTLYEAGKRFNEKASEGKKCYVLYLGDHDPSGIDMSRDVRDRICLFSRCHVEVIRLALNMEQVEKYTPPPNPAKLSDSRANHYIAKFGEESWELDALNPKFLAELISLQIIKLRDEKKWGETLKKEQRQKNLLLKVAKEMKEKSNK